MHKHIRRGCHLHWDLACEDTRYTWESKNTTTGIHTHTKLSEKVDKERMRNLELESQADNKIRSHMCDLGHEGKFLTIMRKRQK